MDGVDQDDHSSRDRIPAAPTDGRTMCVRLWLQIGGVWLYNDYTYTALAVFARTGLPDDPRCFGAAPSRWRRASTCLPSSPGGRQMAVTVYPSMAGRGTGIPPGGDPD